MTVTVALAGDTMLGRGVARQLERVAVTEFVSSEVADLMHAADLCVLNLECCVSDRGEPWPDPAKPFFFRAPPLAVEVLSHLGVDVVTLANNHALDFGAEALADTISHLDAAGIRSVGAGRDVVAARRPVVLGAGGLRIGVIGVTDHPDDYAAAVDRAGVAYADLRRAAPAWLLEAIAGVEGDVTIVTPHWGPNMATAPVRHVRRAADSLVDAGAAVVAGHSAHVFHGVRFATGSRRAAVLFDLGDFIDDYRVDPVRRNDLGLLWLVTFDVGGPVGVEAVPLRLGFARTELATGDDRTWIVARLSGACEPYGTRVRDADDRLVLDAA